MRLAAFFTVLTVLGGASLYSALRSFHHFDNIEHAFAGHCKPVSGIVGPEDIKIDAVAGRAFISSLDRRNAGARGEIYIFDLADPLGAGGWRDRTGGTPVNFKPLGIDYFNDGDVRRLFVVNEANSSVEVFDIKDDGGLLHLETFTERRLTSPNSVAAVGPRSFYVTNDVKPGRNTRMGGIQFLTRAASGQVFYTDGTVWRIAAEGLRFANGIGVSPDGGSVYVAETSGGAIRFYDRNPANGALRETEMIKLGAAPGNISVDETGALWVGAMPKPLMAPRHGADPDTLAPSQVIRIIPGGAPETIYRDDGAEVSASSAAARLGSKLLIGALYGKKFLICDLPPDVI